MISNIRKILGFAAAFMVLFVIVCGSLFIYESMKPGTPVAVAAGLPVWKHAHNESGLSEAAVNVYWKHPMGKYDLLYFSVDPVVNIAGSGCTVEGGTISFPSSSGGDTSRPFYLNGGVTFTPSSLKVNEVVAFWPAINPEIDGVAGRTGASNFFKYE